MEIIDLHMHVVPRIDDGSKSMEMSLEMLSAAYSQGARAIFCTSHGCNGKMYEQYKEAFAALKEEAARVLPELKLYSGCEVYCEYETVDETVKLLKEGKLFTLNNTKYVLTEFYPDIEPVEALLIADALTENGFIPVIAHAERYWMLRSNTVSQLIEKGCAVQINLHSLTKECDLVTRLNAEMYVRSNLVSFVGTDAHGSKVRAPKITEAVEKLESLCSKESFESICNGNARRLILGEVAL